MKLLANENFPLLVVDALRADGHDVVWARTDMPGALDEAILERAQDEERLLVTFDKDFGDLAVYAGLPAACGVVLFRLKRKSPGDMIARVVSALGGTTPWQGNLVVVEDHRIRVRPLPRTGKP